MANVTFQQFADKTNKKLDTLVRTVLIDLDRKLDERSPVGDASYWKNPPPAGYVGGRFRANWQYGFTSQPAGQIDAVDPSGSTTTNRIQAQIESAPAVGIHYIVNNVDYAVRIENGWSRQAPAGVVGLTVMDFEGIVYRQAAK